MDVTATQTLLSQVNAAISCRLSGDSYESYTDGTQNFRGTPLKELLDVRARLQQELAAITGGNFALAEPFYDA